MAGAGRKRLWRPQLTWAVAILTDLEWPVLGGPDTVGGLVNGVAILTDLEWPVLA